MKLLGVGIIGAGGHFGQFVTAALEQMKTIRITAIAERNPQKAEQISRKLGVKYHLDYRALIADPDVQIVVICTPPFLHAQMALEAVRAKKHVFVEKPMATELKDADRLLAR